jgi:hypothetical protein
MLLVDDALLLRVLSGLASGEIGDAAERGELFTTGSWYYRLGMAVTSRQMAGALSRPFAAFSSSRRQRVLAALSRLPEEIGLLSLRDLVPVITALDAGRNLNLLTAEALAAARVLSAGIRTVSDSALLFEAARALGVEVQKVEL